jgi:hypothetical protein
LTSWRRGRMGRFSRCDWSAVTSRRVPKTERADGGRILLVTGVVRTLFGLAHSKPAQRVAINTQQRIPAGVRGPFGDRLFGALVESLILAQDQRWRRA